MQFSSYNFTDLVTFESPQQEVWMEKDELTEFATRAAREMLQAVPDLENKGLCVGVYDEQGAVISYVPLDPLQ